MSKIAVLLGVCLTLSACVVYAPAYVTNQNTVVHYESTSTSSWRSEQQTKEVSERVTPKAKPPTKERKLVSCDAFVLPRDAQKPKYLTAVDLATAKDLPALDKMIGVKMKELQTHIDTMHSKYEQAHQRWMETCTNKVLN